MTYDELVERIQEGETDPKYLEPHEWFAFKALLPTITSTYPEPIKKNLCLEIRDRYNRANDACDIYRDGIKKQQEALTKSAAGMRAIIKAVESGEREFKKLFFAVVDVYEAMTGETASKKSIKRLLKEGGGGKK